MKDLSTHIFEENGVFYFDVENYNIDEAQSNNTIDYEDGDCIKWNWEGKRMMGTLRETPGNLGIFILENTKVLQ
jgi:hypothetical protein